MTQANMQVDEFDLSDAPEMPSGVFTNYGKLTLAQKYMKWENGGTVEVTKDVFKSLPAKVDSKGAKQIDMVFTVDIQEFKPSLSFTFERKVTVDGLDWNKIVAPSIEAVMGKGSMVKGDTSKNVADTRNTTLAKLNGKYVAYQGVPQTPTKKNPDPKYNTFKLIKVYDSREACYADFVAAGGTKSSDNGQSEGFDSTTSVAQNPLIPVAFENSMEAWSTMKGEIQTAVASAETPLIEALNKKHAKAPAPTRKGKIEAEMPSVRAQALAEVAKAKSEEWGSPVTVEQLAALIVA